MKTHYVFCCNNECVLAKMRELTKATMWSTYADVALDTVYMKGCKYIFIADVNQKLEKIKGLEIDSFEVCPNYKLSYDVVEIIITSESWSATSGNQTVEKEKDNMETNNEPSNETYIQKLIAEKCEELKEVLTQKNKEYGDSVVRPLRIFSSANNMEQLDVRIDDKLSRIATDGDKSIEEDTELDFAGYLIMKRVAKANNGRPPKSERGSEKAIKHSRELIAQECDRVKDKLIYENKDQGDIAVMPLQIFSSVSNIERLNVKIDEEISIVFNTRNIATGKDAELNLIGHLIMKRVISTLNKNNEKGK